MDFEGRVKFDREVADLIEGGKLFHTVGAEYLNVFETLQYLGKGRGTRRLAQFEVRKPVWAETTQLNLSDNQVHYHVYI